MAKFKVGDVVIMTEDNSEGVVTAVGLTKVLVKHGNYSYTEEAVFSVNETEFLKLKPKKITITKEMLAKAWDGLIVDSGEKELKPSDKSTFFDYLIRRIGL